jgi:RND family efflux transporter MFP subunit
MINKLQLNHLIAGALMLSAPLSYADKIPPIDCMIEPNIMVEISSPVSGVLDTVKVDRSDEVKTGQIIATLKSDVEQVGVKISNEQLKLSEAEYARAAELFRKKVITLTEKDKSDYEKKLSKLNLQQAKANLKLRQIKSPIDGVVVKRYFSPGEFVESDPIIKLAQLDPLKIEVVSMVSNYGKIVKGMRARVTPEFGDYRELVAEVVVVDKVIDAASGTFGVRLELPNNDHQIPSGLKCKVHFITEETAQLNEDSRAESNGVAN